MEKIELNILPENVLPAVLQLLIETRAWQTVHNHRIAHIYCAACGGEEGEILRESAANLAAARGNIILGLEAQFGPIED